MAETKPITYRISQEVDTEVRRLAKVHGGVDKALRLLMFLEPRSIDASISGLQVAQLNRMEDALGEVLAYVRIVRARREGHFQETGSERTDPAAVPGVAVGMKGLVAKESAVQREKRERAEREARALGLDKSGADRDDVDRSDEFVGY